MVYLFTGTEHIIIIISYIYHLPHTLYSHICIDTPYHTYTAHIYIILYTADYGTGVQKPDGY